MRLAKSNLKGVPLLEADGSQWGWTAPMALELGPRPLPGPHIHILPNPLFWPPPRPVQVRDYFKVRPFRCDGKQLKFCHLQVGFKFKEAITQNFPKQVLSINNSHGSLWPINTSTDCVR